MGSGRGSPDGDGASRWLARAALAAAVAAAGLLVGVAGIRSVGLLALGAAGVVAGLAGLWWLLVYRGIRRLVAAALTIAAPVTVVALYARAGLLWLVLACGALWAVALAVGSAALGRTGTAERVTADLPPRRRPFVIMNPRSGGGKVERFDLVRRARALGAEVVLLDGPGTADVAALARQAVRAGADLLGVAGGDGTQARVAEVAVESGLPFLVVAAGTRNHFAKDLGLDRTDPARCLDALADGVEVRVDVGWAGDRMFVNNASFGAYAGVVQSPAYRADKTATALDLLPDLLTAQHARLRLRAGPTLVAGSQAVLVSNNPYAVGDVAGLGRRERLDGGVLGVLAVNVDSAADAARLVRGGRSRAITRVTAGEVVVDADAPSVPVGIDGEPARVATPVRCRIQPGALRVWVPRTGPGRRPWHPVSWHRLYRLAFPTGRARP
ncbi:diacylglycerol kinase family protein [Dactylosporangium sp. NPDC005572]|uniref:diacylglycerol/lipid kinase family protein n=1 Tax=Dactylosporangium sp. NPDC005572 TaxID=3156889 RepID=UPI0033A9EAF8